MEPRCPRLCRLRFASFLLGGAQAIAINAPINLQTENYQSAAFLQDSWKFSRKLTLDYGLRWDYGTYQKEQFAAMETSPPHSESLGERTAWRSDL